MSPTVALHPNVAEVSLIIVISKLFPWHGYKHTSVLPRAFSLRQTCAVKCQFQINYNPQPAEVGSNEAFYGKRETFTEPES